MKELQGRARDINHFTTSVAIPLEHESGEATLGLISIRVYFANEMWSTNPIGLLLPPNARTSAIYLDVLVGVVCYRGANSPGEQVNNIWQ